MCLFMLRNNFENLTCLYNISVGSCSLKLYVFLTSLIVCHKLPLVSVFFLVSIVHEDFIFITFSVSD